MRGGRDELKWVSQTVKSKQNSKSFNRFLVLKELADVPKEVLACAAFFADGQER